MNQSRDHQLTAAADILLAARINAQVINSLPEALKPVGIDESYQLQDHLNRRLSAAEPGKKTGYKIGCTTQVMQKYLGIAHPCSGALFAASTQQHNGEFSAARLCRPGVECEIAVQLDADMPAGQTYTAADCDSFVRAAMCSIELVDDRWTDYRSVDPFSLIADNFFAAGCVLGEPVKLSSPTLAAVKGNLRINGSDIGSGSASDILGHPYEALAWLANHQVQRGSPLQAGDYISLGSVVQTYWLNPGDTVSIEFTELGSCTLQLTE
ncbi:hypothetical protein AB833_22905 [Chromatiales bacterium (ex Bugula neritina AB1)]|nr:hypothetical protein AB833_22905 [Chromatiales bacterium (ex Bugula neritina AB1)]